MHFIETQGAGMPITYRIDEREKLVVTTIRGRVDETDVRAHAAITARDPRVHACPRALVDIGSDVQTTVESGVVSELSMVSTPTDEPPGRKVAVVAPTDSTYGLARVFQGFRTGTGGGEVQVFRTRAQAEAWLGLSNEKPIKP
jgi:hypothetical protein